jgi:predicted metalloprotease with PDZ domain
MVVGDGYGGLEHRASTALLCSRNDLPVKNQQEIGEEYRTFLGLCSHEYFHTWNVKRIKPESYLPYDLSQETYTRQLWAFEGITSYYDDLGLVRSGLINPESYLELLGQTMTRVYRGEGRLKQSVADSSFDTWTKFYKQDESAPNNIVSYYTKGSLIALALDLTIRKITNQEASLDTVMQRLWQEHGNPLIGVPEKQIEKIASDIAGIDLSDFFQRYLYNTEDIPFDELMLQVGVQWQLQPTTNLDDKGGKFQDDIDTTATWVGARFGNDSSGAKLVHVLDNSPAQNAGLSAGDVIIALNNIRVNKQNIEKLLAPYTVVDNLEIHAFRRDELMRFQLKLEPAPKTTCAMKFLENPEEAQLINRKNWLKIIS